MARHRASSGVARNAFENQRSITASAIASMPPPRTASIRSAQLSRVPILAPVLEITIARTWSSRFTARPWAIMPPIERPTKTTSRSFR